MKLNIDLLTNITGWTATAPNTIEVNNHTQFVAGLNSTSLLLGFKAAATTREISKTISPAIDVTDYETLVISVWSQQKKKQDYRKASDFSYKIKLNATNEFYLSAYNTFTDINIAIEAVTSIDRIEITPLHTDDDYLVISECVVEKEEIPLDLLLSTKEYIGSILLEDKGKGILLGTLTGTIGDRNITLSADWIDQYSVILIDDGVNSETHQLGNGTQGTWKLKSNFSGRALLHDYDAADVYLTFPVHINPDENEIQLPGIAVWGIDPEPISQTGKLDSKIEGWHLNDTFSRRDRGQILLYSILIDCESRHSELIDIMTRIVRKVIEREILWVNGRRHDVTFGAAPTELQPPQGVDIIPKVQYTMSVEVIENIFDRVVLEKTTTIDLTVSIQGE